MDQLLVTVLLHHHLLTTPHHHVELKGRGGAWPYDCRWSWWCCSPLDCGSLRDRKRERVKGKGEKGKRRWTCRPYSSLERKAVDELFVAVRLRHHLPAVPLHLVELLLYAVQR